MRVLSCPPAVAHSLSSSEITGAASPGSPATPFPAWSSLACGQWDSGACFPACKVSNLWCFVFENWKLSSRLTWKWAEWKSACLKGMELGIASTCCCKLSHLLQHSSSATLRGLSRCHWSEDGGNCHGSNSCTRAFRQAKGGSLGEPRWGQSSYLYRRRDAGRQEESRSNSEGCSSALFSEIGERAFASCKV